MSDAKTIRRKKKHVRARPGGPMQQGRPSGPSSLDWRPWFAGFAISLVLGAFTWWAWAPREAPEPHVARGNELYEARRYREALSEYESAPGAGPRNAGVHLDRGLARYRVTLPSPDGGGLPILPPDASTPEELSRAQDELRTAARGGTTGAEEDVDAFLRARAAYDLGNTFFSQRAWDNAIDAYKTALRLRPGWRDAAWNLELARRLREEERTPPDAGQDAAQDASQDAGQDASNDSGQHDGGQDSGRDGGGDSGSDHPGDAGSQGDGGQGDAGSDSHGDAGVQRDAGASLQDRDAQAPRSMAPLDDLDRISRSLQEEMMRRRGMMPRGTDDDRKP